MTTGTDTYTTYARDLLNSGAVGSESPGAELIKHGDTHCKIKAVFSTATGFTAIDITTAASKAIATVTGIHLKTGENLPAIGSIVALGVGTGATGSTGPRLAIPAGFTASATMAALSDDGKTLTFEAQILGFTLEYYPAPATAS